MESISSIIIPIVLSIISALIFWLVFSFCPKKVRYNKLRPKVDQDIVAIVSQLFQMFRIIMSENLNSQSCLYGRKIISGKLTKDEIELGLQNKCLNSSCLKGDKVDKHFVQIGEKLCLHIAFILKKIDELYFFSELLTTNEILLLEKIKKSLKINDFSNYKKPNQYLIPNLSNNTMYFFTLYGFYCELLSVIFQKKTRFIKTIIYYDIGVPLAEIDYHFYFSKNYKKCKKAIQKAIKYSSEDIFKISEIKCEYLLGRKNSAFSKFKTFLLNYKPGLIPISHIIDEWSFLDERILGFIKKNYSEEEYTQLIANIKKANNLKSKREKNFIKTNRYLKNYYAEQQFK